MGLLQKCSGIADRIGRREMHQSLNVVINHTTIQTYAFDEYVYTDLRYLELLEAMIDEQFCMKFFVQCDTQIAKQERLIELLAKAGCYQMFVDVESFDRIPLIAVNKKQNRPEALGSLAMSSFVRYCAWRRTHPMSGGIMRVRLDSVGNYLDLWKRLFGFELVPLPQSLNLIAMESSMSPTNHLVGIQMKTQSPLIL